MYNNRVKKILNYIIIFLCVLALLTGLLILVAKLPREKMKDNMLESAKFLCEGELFGEAVEGVPSSKIDRYADSILLAIAYQYDSDHTVESVLWSSYYYNPMANENDNLYTAVTEGKEANTQYLRYWHGSNVIVRPLLTVFHIKQIYVFHAVILLFFVLLLLVVLLKYKAYVPFWGMIAALVVTASWFVPFSLEYIWTYLVMLMMSTVGVVLAYQKRFTSMGILFMVGGMLTNYLDFLSTETITLTVPLLLILWIKAKQESFQKKELITFTCTNVIAWGAGYVGMWISKWVLSAIVLKQNVIPYISEHIGERLDGDLGLNPIQYVIGAIWRNVKCLFPLDYGASGLFIGCGIAFFVLYVGYVYYSDKGDKSMLWFYVCIALIPYIRYIVLHNHAYLHNFFTYRAQMPVVLATVFVLELLTDGRWLRLGTAKRK